MTTLAARTPSTRPLRPIAVSIAVAALAGGFVVRGAALEGWYVAFMLLSGLTVGSLGLLIIGHILGEDWLAPVRDELEAASLTAPLLLLLAVPMALDLGAVFPWASAGADALPEGREAYFAVPFFLARGVLYLVAWSALAVWIVRSPAPRQASSIGLAIFLPTAVFAANDWAMSRDPHWWSSLFGFAFTVTQLLGGLAASILITLLADPRAHATRLASLERGLLTLALLAMWIWFSQFLIVWLANLPPEVAWYARRGGERLALLVYVAGPALGLALILLLPTGARRALMVAGSALILVAHMAFMLWTLHPAPAAVSLGGLAGAAGLAALWGGWFAATMWCRPGFDEEALRAPD